MKSVLISIRPQWTEKIVKRIKTIEVRKSAPKEVPFKCYIYMTATKERCRLWEYITAYQNSMGDIVDGSQKVIGEFICDKVEKLEEHIEQGGLYYTLAEGFNEQAQLDNWELYDYGKGKTIYGWHISDLKIYDKPRNLSEFGKVGFGHEVPLKRPPQSWMYVEDLGEVR